MNGEQDKSGKAFIFVLVSFLFLLSGASALVYEVAWVKKFSVVAGGSTRSLTAVIAAYMGGLALGSFLGGRYIDRRKSRPFLVYAVLEGLIGVSAFLLTLLIPWLHPVLKLGQDLFGVASFGFDFYRFVVSALVMFIPTTLMGATFPVLIRGVLSSKARFGAVAGVLYASNTLGAMAGSLLSSFLLIPSLGIFRTIGVAALLNVFILLVAFALPFFRKVETEGPVVEKGPRKSLPKRPLLLWMFLIGYAVSGLCAMVYQVSWARAMSFSLGSSTYAVGIIFASFIGGLALGGFLISPVVDRMKSRYLLAAGLEIIIGLSAIAVIPLFESVTLGMFHWAHSYQEDFSTYQLLRFAVAFGLILVPTAAMGALFPVVVKIAGLMEEGVGEPAGEVYAFNTVGGIVGSFLAAHVFIRLLGLENALFAATAISVAIGLVWLVVSPSGKRVFRFATAAALAGAVAAGILLIPEWDPLLMNSGPYIYSDIQRGDLPAGMDIEDFLHDTEKVIFHEAGVEATVSVMERRRHKTRLLRMNGKTVACSKNNMAAQVLEAHLPLLLHPHPEEIMIIGLGAGVSTGSALLHPLKRVDCAEISPAVVSASRLFKETGASKLDYEDPRLNLIMEDGRHYLDLSDKRYDVIVVDPLNPWVSGMGVLFTHEFFQIMREHLKPDGLVLIWIPVSDMDAYTVKMLLRTFHDVFENCSVWEERPMGEYFLIGTLNPLKVDVESLMERGTRSKIKEDMARVDVNRPDHLFARFVMGAETIKRVAGEGPLHTDDRRQLEFILPKIMNKNYDQRMDGLITRILSGHQPAISVVADSKGGYESLLQKYDLNRTIYYRNFRKRIASEDGQAESSDLRIQNWYNLIQRCNGAFPADYAKKHLSMLLYRRAKGYFRQSRKTKDKKEQIQLARRGLADLHESFRLDPENSNAADMLINYYKQSGRTRQAVQWAQKALQAVPGDPYALTILAEWESNKDELERAEYLFRQAVQASPRSGNYRYNLAAFLAQRGKLEEAKSQLETLFKFDPPNERFKELYCSVLNDLGEKAKAQRCFRRLEALPSQKVKED